MGSSWDLHNEGSFEMFLLIYFLYISGATENPMTLIISILDNQEITKKNHRSQDQLLTLKMGNVKLSCKMMFPLMTKRTVYTSMASITKVWFYIWCNLAAAMSSNDNLVLLVL